MTQEIRLRKFDLPLVETTIQNFQSLKPKGKRYPDNEDRRDIAPYGLWTEPDGTEVLFNRRYKPIYWRNLKARTAGEAPRDQKVRVSTQEWFRDDGRFNPSGDTRHYQRCIYILGLFMAFESMEPVILRGWEHSIPNCPPPD